MLKSLTTLLCIAGAVFTVVTGAESVRIADEFHSFSRGRSAVALEDRSDKELWDVVGPKDGIACSNGVLVLRGKPGSEIRLFSRQRFLYGTFTARVRFDTVGPSFNIYTGFANREPWAASVAWAQFTDSGNGILLSSANHTLPTNITAVETGDFKAGVWHTIRIVWNPDKVELFVDDQSCGAITEKPAVPQHAMPVVFAIYSLKEPYSLSIDSVEVIGGQESTEASATAPGQTVTPVPMPVMPVIPVCPEPPDCPAIITVSEPYAALENRYFKVGIDCSKGFAINELYSKCLRKNLLSAPAPLVLVHEGLRTLNPADYTVKMNRTQANGLLLELTNPAEKVKLELTLTLTPDSPELEIQSALVNLGAEKRQLALSIPVLTGLKIGEKPEQDEYFFPFESGMAGTLDCELDQGYGCTAFFPLLSVYNPLAGGGCYIFIKEQNGYPNVLMLKKQSQAKFTGSVYNVMGDIPVGIFPNATGTHIGVRHTAFDLAPGKRSELSPAVIGVHQGNFHEPLTRYADFAHRTWFHKEFPTPRWYMDCYGYLSAHMKSGLHLLHAPQSTGYYDQKREEFCYGRQVGPQERNVLMEFAGVFDNQSQWKNMTQEEIVEAGIPLMNAHDVGNYDYNRARGGLTALRAEIETIHKNGGRFTFYTWPQGCARGTKLSDLYGKKWARMIAPDRYDVDYTGEDMGWNLCWYEHEFGEVLSKIFAQRLKECGADGYRLDVFSRLGGCFNPAHSHYDGSLRSTVNPKAAGEVLTMFLRRAREVNPEAIVTAEHGANDFLAQFHDGYFSENICWMGATGMWEPFRALNMYGLVFQRFYFPEIKTWIHGPADRKLALKMSLFNAVGYACSDAAGVTSIHTLEENGDAFNSGLRPMPLVPTLQKNVFANCFPGESKRIWCIWNRNDAEVSGALLALEPKAGCHYVELYQDNPFAVNAGQLTGTLPSHAVGVVAELPQILECRIADNFLNITIHTENPDCLSFEVLYDENDYLKASARMQSVNGKAAFAIRKEYKKIIVKLFNDRYLMDEIVIRR